MAHSSHSEIIEKRKSREKEARRKVIMNAARDLFFSRGYAKTTMDEIALEAEISKPTIYQYFNNKDDLYFSLTIPLLERMLYDMEEMSIKLNSGGYSSGREIISDHLNTYLEILKDDPQSFRIFMLFMQTGVIFEVKREVANAISSMAKKRYNGMRELYTLAMNKRLIKKVNVYHLVDMIWGVFLGALNSLDAKQRGGKLHGEFIPVVNFAADIISESIAIHGEKNEHSIK